MGSLFKKFLNSTIRTKLIITGLFLSFVATLTTSVIFVRYDTVTIKEFTLRELELVGRIIGKRTAPALKFNQKTMAQRNLYDLENKTSIIKACIYDSDEKIFSSYLNNAPTICPTYAPELISEYTSDKIISHLKIIDSGGEQVGSVYLESDLYDVNKHIYQISFWSIIIVIGVMALSYFLATRVQRYISTPIHQLSSIAKEVTDHADYNIQVEKVYDDEVGELTNRFNVMLDKIHRRDQRLQEINSTLEDKIIDRTRDLQAQKVKAEEANEAKTEFLRNMSHEFRTPLHAMKSFSDFGLNDAEEADRADLKRYFHNISQVTDRLTKLVNGLLFIARLESGNEQFNMQRTDFNFLIGTVVTEQQALVASNKITIHYDIAEFDTHVVCDDQKIIQVITNLLGNAVKFTPEGKSIWLELHDDGDNFIFNCIDNGVGIPEDEIDKIFESFAQSSRTKSKAGGTGLGLAIANGFVKGHGGDIWCANNDKGGATFSFSIPKTITEGEVAIPQISIVDGTVS